jgi:hypothetical protein
MWAFLASRKEEEHSSDLGPLSHVEATNNGSGEEEKGAKIDCKKQISTTGRSGRDEIRSVPVTINRKVS